MQYRPADRCYSRPGIVKYQRTSVSLTPTLSPIAADAAVKAGFRVRRSEPVYLLDRTDVWGTRAPNIHFQLSDLDAIFLDEGGVLALC